MKGTIKSKEEVERLFSVGRRSSSSLLLVLASQKMEGGPGRCAFIAGKKIGSAPLRNRYKRVMREAVRQVGGPWNNYDVVLLARRGLKYRRKQEVVEDLYYHLEKLGIV